MKENIKPMKKAIKAKTSNTKVKKEIQKTISGFLKNPNDKRFHKLTDLRNKHPEELKAEVASLKLPINTIGNQEFFEDRYTDKPLFQKSGKNSLRLSGLAAERDQDILNQYLVKSPNGKMSEVPASLNEEDIEETWGKIQKRISGPPRDVRKCLKLINAMNIQEKSYIVESILDSYVMGLKGFEDRSIETLEWLLDAALYSTKYFLALVESFPHLAKMVQGISEIPVTINGNPAKNKKTIKLAQKYSLGENSNIKLKRAISEDKKINSYLRGKIKSYEHHRQILSVFEKESTVPTPKENWKNEWRLIWEEFRNECPQGNRGQKIWEHPQFAYLAKPALQSYNFKTQRRKEEILKDHEIHKMLSSYIEKQVKAAFKRLAGIADNR